MPARSCFQALLPDTFGSPENAFWVGAFATVIITGIYTVFGGMRAIMNTATPQAVIILLGSFIITAIGLCQAGRLGRAGPAVPASTTRAVSRSGVRCRIPDFPWLGVLIASPIIGLWYWCTDQYIVQRTLSAKDLATARRGALFGGLLKVWPVLIFLIPGMIGWALHQKGIIQLPLKIGRTAATAHRRRPGLSDPGQAAPARRDPRPDRGLPARGPDEFAGLAVQLERLAVHRGHLREAPPGPVRRHLLMVGRIATAVVVGLGMIWIPVMAKISGGGLYQYLQSVQGYLAPPDHRGVLPGSVLEAHQRGRRHLGPGRRFRPGHDQTDASRPSIGKGKIAIPALLAADRRLQLPLRHRRALRRQRRHHGRGLPADPAAASGGEDQGLTYGSIHKEAADEIKRSWDLGNKVLAAIILAAVLSLYLYFTFWLG